MDVPSLSLPLCKQARDVGLYLADSVLSYSEEIQCSCKSYMHKQKEALELAAYALKRRRPATRGAATPPRCMVRSFCDPFFESSLSLQSPRARVIRTGGIKWNGEKSKNGTDCPFRFCKIKTERNVLTQVELLQMQFYNNAIIIIMQVSYSQPSAPCYSILCPKFICYSSPLTVDMHRMTY